MTMILILSLLKAALLIKQQKQQSRYEAWLINANHALEETVRDRTTLIEAQKQQLKLAANVFSGPNEGILITDEHNNIIDVNDALIRITGFTREELIGQNPHILHSGKMSDPFYQQMWQSLEKDNYWQGEIEDFNHQGNSLCMLASISTIRNDQGTVTNYICNYTNITDLKQQQKALADMAYKDALTALPNRHYFFDQLQRLLKLALRQEYRVAICYIYLDGFKPINDTFGHEAGDQVLKTTANRLNAFLRESDLVARLGGDEFVIVLNIVKSTSSIHNIVERLLTCLCEPINIDEQTVQVGASIGVSLFPEHGQVIDELMQKADQAMYQIKHQHKNSYQIYEPTV